MKAYLLLAASGPLMILTSHASVLSPQLLEKLNSKGVGKFLAYEVPLDLARARYGGHFSVVTHDLASAFEVGDRVGVHHAGRIIETGTPDEIQKSGNPVVVAFLKGEDINHVPASAGARQED